MSDNIIRKNVFIAGSKSLEEERHAVAYSIGQSAHEEDEKVVFDIWTYESFARVFVEKGQQHEYDKFIANETDVFVLIADESIGGITVSEFEVAWKAWEASRKRPQILMYYRKGSRNVDSNIRRICELIGPQYYTEYESLKDLRSEVQKDFRGIAHQCIKAKADEEQQTAQLIEVGNQALAEIQKEIKEHGHLSLNPKAMSIEDCLAKNTPKQPTTPASRPNHTFNVRRHDPKRLTQKEIEFLSQKRTFLGWTTILPNALFICLLVYIVICYFDGDLLLWSILPAVVPATLAVMGRDDGESDVRVVLLVSLLFQPILLLMFVCDCAKKNLRFPMWSPLHDALNTVGNYASEHQFMAWGITLLALALLEAAYYGAVYFINKKVLEAGNR